MKAIDGVSRDEQLITPCTLKRQSFMELASSKIRVSENKNKGKETIVGKDEVQYIPCSIASPSERGSVSRKKGHVWAISFANLPWASFFQQVQFSGSAVN